LKGGCELHKSAFTKRIAQLLKLRLHKRGLAICLSGIDGSGKTTLAQELVQVLGVSGVPARHLHLHQWYLNVSITPVLLIYNRYFGRKVLVFDRTIYDNIAVASLRPRWPWWLSLLTLRFVLACYPRFDHRFYLAVTLAETNSRRPGTDIERFRLLSGFYGKIVHRAKYVQVMSDAQLLDTVLRRITRGSC